MHFDQDMLLQTDPAATAKETTDGAGYRQLLRSRQRIVVKIGSSSLLHPETGRLDYHRIDRLARELSDLKNQGREVILVSSGATAVGREAMGALGSGMGIGRYAGMPGMGSAVSGQYPDLSQNSDTGKLSKMGSAVSGQYPDLSQNSDARRLSKMGSAMSGQHADFPSAGEVSMSRKQAFASIGQARLIMIYQKFFEDYNQVTGQILMTKTTIVNASSKQNLCNTLSELLMLGVIPIVNENDSVATLEYSLGDNDSLSAMVAAVIHADLLILLSDVDGLYTDDPRSNLDAKFIDFVPHLTDEIMSMGKETTGSGVGTGGMNTKLHAAKMATASGCDMVIVNTKNGMDVIGDVMDGRSIGTLFCAEYDPGFDLVNYVEETY